MVYSRLNDTKGETMHRPSYAGGFVALAILIGSAAAHACDTPRQMDGFKTCADVAKAEEEGAFVLYSTDPEAGSEAELAKFHAMFPKIKTNYVRLQAGALYAKLSAERQAKSYLVDVVQLSDISFARDFEKRGGYMSYVSPEMAAYKPEYKSQPEGSWTWGAISMAGIAYNPNLVSKDEAPKTWKDMLDPKWTDSVTVKTSTSGMQHMTWYQMRLLYGDDYWQKFAALKPKAFDSYVQQFDRTVNGQDKVIDTAQYSGYLQFKAKGAPIEYVYPPDGLVAVPEFWGVVKEAPHQEAAKLFLDWFLGVPGQKGYGEALFYNSIRDDVPPPAGGVKASELKLLFPADWEAFLKTHTQFVREWDKITGLR
ncbi:MAG TPA: extracellular solute-binding protein [Acetobacteraceae bacterium]|jgi:iron(III) transport system substrate-binding protein|nr:extracellular solute-binding protein [Acetobacteraceae bacterium]